MPNKINAKQIRGIGDFYATGWVETEEFTPAPLVTVIADITFTFAASDTVTASADCVAKGVKVGDFIYNSDDDAVSDAKQIIEIAADKVTITLAAAYAGTAGATKEGSVFGDKLTLTEDLTGTVKVGNPVKFVVDSVSYRGVVEAISSDELSIMGPAIAGDVEQLFFGPADKVSTIQVVIPSTYEDASNTGLIVSDIKSELVWEKAEAYLVGFKMYTDTADGSGDGQASITIEDVECFLQAGGPILAAAKTWYSSGIGIDPTNYKVSRGDVLEVTAIAGTGMDASDLSAKLIFVSE